MSVGRSRAVRGGVALVVLALAGGSLARTGGAQQPDCPRGYGGSLATRPEAVFTYSPPSPHVGETVTFDGSRSRSDRPIIRWYWEVDGRPESEFEQSGPSPTATAVYHFPGRVQVALVVEDSCRRASDVRGEFVDVVALPTVTAGRAARMRTVLGRGFPAGVQCSLACGVSAELRATASARRARIPRVVGRSAARLDQAGQAQLRIRPGRPARRALRRVRRAALRLHVRIHEAGHPRREVVRPVTLSR